MGKSKAKSKKIEVAINKADYSTIIDLGAQHRSKKNNFSFCDELKSLNEDDLTKLMKQLVKILMEYVEKNLDQSTAVDWTTLNPEQCKTIGLFIHAITDIGLACIQCDLTDKCRVELVQIAVFLHGIMLPMPDNMDYVKNCIAHYCEKLFSTGLLENCEIFLNNVVLYLVRKTLARKAAKVDVKRIYAIRKILSNIMKIDSPTTAQLSSFFLDCAVSQTYLSILEGQKVIALVMTLDSYKLLKMHEKIVNYIPGISIKTAIGYGKVYFEAWCYSVKKADSDMRNTIEITCLQQFILMGVQSKQKHILPIIRKILNQFFINKKDPEVSSMLYSMYQPLIWRYLKNPNGLYRACAAQLFLDIFPLEDPQMRVVKHDMEVNEQLLMIQELLSDDFPIVRITAVLGICVSMSVNWEVFPEENIDIDDDDIEEVTEKEALKLHGKEIRSILEIRSKMLKTFFRIIVNDLSRDSACDEVRIAVVKGLKCLLENPLTVRCLVGILPKLTGLFHDICENVRIAFCQLLLRVKKISAIKYFDIVPINHLFARMEEDCHAVKKCLTNLLHNSYFPKNQDPKLWLGRCLEIIKSERIASRVFFSYVSTFIGVESSVKFMIQAAKAVHFYVKTKSSSAQLDVEISDKENIRNFTEYINSLEQAVGFGNLTVVITMMEAIAVMWLSLKPDADNKMENKSFMKMLVVKMATCLGDLCLYYKDTEAWEAVFYLSSFLPTSHVKSLPSLCFNRLKSLPADAQESDYMTLLECLANQLQTRELLNNLKEWIEIGLSSTYKQPPTKKRRGRAKSGEGINHGQMKPYLANRMLNSILNHRNLQKRALLERSALQEIMYLSDNIKRKLEIVTNDKLKARLMTEAEADFLNLLIYNIVRLSVHLHNLPNYDPSTSVPFVNDFVKWANDTLVKHLVDEKNHFTLLVFRICENLCKVLGDVTALGFFEPNNCLYLDFICSLLNTAFGHKFILIASRYLYKHAASSQFNILLDSDTTMMQHHLCYLGKFFEHINKEDMLEKIPEKELVEITFTLANVMQIIHNHVNKLRELTSEVFKIILKNILDCAASKCADIVVEMAEDPFDRLSFPNTGNFFYSIVSQKPQLSRTYVKYLADMFKESQDIAVSKWIAYWMVIWSFLHARSVTQPVVKEIYSLVLELEKCLHSLYPRGKDSEQNNSQEPSEPVPLQLFQHHCHAELIKLKNRVKSKLHVSKSTKKQ